MSKNNRYRVGERSTSGHCCFNATIVDNMQPHKYRDPDGNILIEIDGLPECEGVCETFDIEVAQAIADALNGSK
jgi:hypothetical protein